MGLLPHPVLGSLHFTGMDPAQRRARGFLWLGMEESGEGAGGSEVFGRASSWHQPEKRAQWPWGSHQGSCPYAKSSKCFAGTKGDFFFFLKHSRKGLISFSQILKLCSAVRNSRFDTIDDKRPIGGIYTCPHVPLAGI